MGPGRIAVVASALACCALATPLPAAAAPEPQPYGTNDGGGFRDLLPPGANGRVNGTELIRFFSGGERPPHNDDQLSRYADLLRAPRPFGDATVASFFKDSTFGVKPDEVERRYSPRDDVTIVRDSAFGVPHIYGETRAGAMFGVGYATAEDRLFFVDILRHVGRAQLSSFAGGNESNRAMDRSVWQVAPYREEDLERQATQERPGFQNEAATIREDSRNYVDGINKYIAEARLDPSKMPGEYPAVGKPEGPADWKQTDSIAVATLVGAVFGVGGGGELRSALALQAAQARFGAARGTRVWRDFRSANDPEAPTTVHRRSFSYQPTPKRPRGTALPDPGTVKDFVDLDPAAVGAESVGGALALPPTMSNALLVSARESSSGRPLAVFGPQTGYFAPEILMEQDLHAPGLDARGVGFPGANLYVSLGHGRDYAWSATSAVQDMVDTYAVPLCEPGGAPPTVDSMHYVFRGECRPIEVRERANSWTPNAADQTPPGSETLRAQVTAMGIVTARATVRGRPVVYTKLRSTYLHEPDSSLGLSYWNSPDQIHGPRDFQKAASLVNYAFNWFYIDHEHIAYLNSGLNPDRPPGTDPDLPVWGVRKYEWRGWDPGSNVIPVPPIASRAQVVDQSYLTSWNNKQARGVRASDRNWSFGPVHRSQPLDDRLKPLIEGKRKATLPQVAEAMEDAATVDLRGDKVLPWALRVLGKQTAPVLATAIAKLRAWQRAGAHRIDRDGNGRYEDSDAITVMDAWWPLWMRAQFEPVLGRPLFEAIRKIHPLDNHPNNHGQHLGSGWQDGWYGNAQKDLRTLLGARVRGRYSRLYCGKGRLDRCRAALATSLREALGADTNALYHDEICDAQGRPADQKCFDAIWFRALGAVTQPLIDFQNRPTYQQAVEVRARAPR
jgi:acyl-homoserine lactone acylase PvdQ